MAGLIEMLTQPMPEGDIATLRAINKHLRSALVRLRPEQQHCSAITPQDFSDLSSEIRRAADCVRRIFLDHQPAAELKKASLEYRRNLEQLKHLLPDLQVRLLAEKSRLEVAKNHVAAAAAWVGASTRTF
jgi:hypothetical protein